MRNADDPTHTNSRRCNIRARPHTPSSTGSGRWGSSLCALRDPWAQRTRSRPGGCPARSTSRPATRLCRDPVPDFARGRLVTIVRSRYDRTTGAPPQPALPELPVHPLTIADYLTFGEPLRGYTELEEGKLVMSPSPFVVHNLASYSLCSQLTSQLPVGLRAIQDVDIDLQFVPP